MLNNFYLRDAKGMCFDDELDLICNFHYNDFNKQDLVAELSTFHKIYHSAVEDQIPSVSSTNIFKTALVTNDQ